MLQEYPQTLQLLVRYVPNNLGIHLRIERIDAFSSEMPVEDKVMNDIEKDCSVGIVCILYLKSVHMIHILTIPNDG